MRIFKDKNGCVIIDGEGQLINTGILVATSITNIANSVTIKNFHIVSEEVILEVSSPGETIEKRVEDRIKEIIRDRLILRDFIMDSLSKRFELLDLGE